MPAEYQNVWNWFIWVAGLLQAVSFGLNIKRNDIRKNGMNSGIGA